MGSHPWHRYDCVSRTFKAPCRECQAPVHVYWCSCGSGVAFDQLGPPWPVHDCYTRYLKEKIAPILRAGADPRSAMHRPFEALAVVDPSRLAPEKADGNGEASFPELGIRPNPRIGEHTTKVMRPLAGEEPYFLLATLRELSGETQRVRELYASLGDLGRRVLDLPARTRAVQITVVESQGEPNESYTGVIDRSLVPRTAEPGVMVATTLVARVQGPASTWLFTSLDLLD